MINTRVKIRQVVENQLPKFVIDSNPEFIEFLTEYFKSTEVQGGPIDILNNIDQYVKLENISELVYSTTATSDIDFSDTVINVDSTDGFPDNYGLIQINNEVISYESKNKTTFINCSRGFSGITSYRNFEEDSLIFTESFSAFHVSGSEVINLSTVFLAELYKKFKSQYAFGFDSANFYPPLNEKVFLSRVKDFYSSKGSSSSFRVLFKALYGVDVDVIKPRDYVIQASDADFRITRDLVVERISGDPEKLVNLTLFQDETNFIQKAEGSITNVEKIFRDGREYYQISLDYNPDIEVFKFTVHPNTKLVTSASEGQSFLDVDSTVSFPNSGTLKIKVNGINYTIQYTSKTINQFLGCTGVINIPANTPVYTPDYAYGIGENGEIIQVRVTGVLSDLEYPDDTYYYSPGDEMEVVSLGKSVDSPAASDWIFNTTPTYDVKSIVQLTNKINGAARFRITTYDPNILTVGDPGTLTSSLGQSFPCFVISTSDKFTFDINLTFDINTNAFYKIKKGIAKANSINYTNVNNISADVQNVYIDGEDYYVASHSLPNYFNTPLNLKNISIPFSGVFEGEELNIGENPFYTGDAVYYSGNGENNKLSIPEGLYFIKKLNASKIKLATSRSNISNNIFISAFGTVSNNRLSLFKFYNKQLNPQGLFRKISKPVDEDVTYSTNPGQIGILKNGVEILNYKSNDSIFYGEIEEILVSAPGSDYDVINPPILHIDDKISIGSTSTVGSGATGVCNVVGSLKKINIIDKGYDYVSDPIITITGGNGFGAKATCNMAQVKHSVSFSAGFQYQQIDILNNNIGFTTDHKFRDNEKVVYRTFNQSSVGGLTNDSIYYVKIIDERTVQFHTKYEDSVLGINTVSLTSFGDGIHSIEAFEKKKVISSIEVISGGSNYSSKQLFFQPEDVDLYRGTITIKNHGYKDKEIVNYHPGTESISGLSSTSDYYVKVIDNNTIKLCLVGVGTTSQDFYYDSQRYVIFESDGLGAHSLKYQPIVVKVEGNIGVSTVNNQDFRAIIQPIFRGTVESISLSNKGQKYGDPEILNYSRQPLVTLLSGQGALASPVVSSNGEIIDIIINNRGTYYNSPPSITIDGDGFGCILTPILKNGQIESIKVINGGSGYRRNNTFIRIIGSGNGAKFESRIKPWTVNLVERLFNDDLISADDGILSTALNEKKELEYTHAYIPREFRNKILSTSLDEQGNLRYRPDLINDDVILKYHSPLIGWAYDGNPIYGPYAYADREGGSVRRMRSGYKLRPSSLRPPGYVAGFFVEDYDYVGDGDLDIHNGRFCKTPEFPNGVYAYFSTINDTKESSGPFNGFLKPVFPYFIGNTYKSTPIEFNYYQFSNQDTIDINETKWQRNVYPYSLLKSNTYYEGFVQPDKFIGRYPTITVTSPGPVDSLKLISPGDNYSINDNIFFDNTNTGGSGAYARIVEIEGRDVENIEYSFSKYEDVNFVPYNSFGRYIGFSTVAHNFAIGDVVSIQNLNILKTEFTNTFPVGITTNILSLTKYIPDSSITGIVTYFDVVGPLTYPNIVVNDILGIGTERVKVLEIDTKSSRIKVRREFESTIGLGHSEGAQITELPRKFFVNVGYNTTFDYQLSRELYFYPTESICIPSENLLTYSTPENFSPWRINTVGSGSTVSVSYYDSLSPDNTNTAAKVVLGIVTSTQVAGIANTVLSLASDFYTGSVFLRGQTGGEKVYAIIEDGINFITEEFTLTTDWKRYSFTGSANAGLHRFFVGGWGASGVGATTNGGTFYVWGAQVESGSLMTPFKKTNSSIVVRNQNQDGVTYFSNPGNGLKQIIIPFKSIYLPGHKLQTGDQIVYKSNGNTPLKVSTASSTYELDDNFVLYAAKINEDFIGISSVSIGIGTTGGFVGLTTTISDLLYSFGDYGSGLDHSFVTTPKNIIVGDVYKKSAVITTKRNHGLQSGDNITVTVLSGIQTTFVLKYDSINRRTVVNPKSFTALDVDIDADNIRILNHGFVQGQKIIHNSSTPCVGLENAKIYYVIVIDDNTIKLSNNYYKDINRSDFSDFINISTASFGTISAINPEITAIKDSTVIFDLSDPTLASNGLPSFDFDLYIDNKFKTKFFTTTTNKGLFNVRKYGVIGEPGASVHLILDENVPDLFYKLSPIFYDGAPVSRINSIDDDYNIVNNNRLSLVKSKFNQTASITGVTTNTFTYSILETPEKPFYADNEAIVRYSTTSRNAIGPVYKVSLESRGRNYNVLPNIVNINSGLGTNALFLPSSKSLGKIYDYEIRDIGFDYPSDLSLRPSVNIPSTYKIEPLSKFKEIKILSPGINYFVAPQLVVLDGFTGRLNTEVDLRYELGDTQVTIVRNTTGLYNVKPLIIPVNNPNGARISSISFDDNTLDVTVGLAVTYASIDLFPFVVGEKIIIENTNIDLIEGGKGYNSSNYGYALFTLTDADAKIGLEEEPILKYSLSGYLTPGENPGIYDSFESFGTVTPERYFPKFDIKLEKDTFRKGEIISTDSGAIGIVQKYDQKNEYLKVRTKYEFKVDDLIIGNSSGNKGLISSVEQSKGVLNIGSNSITRKGWRKQTGYLNNDFQRIHDNDYYQYFSYVLKSSVDFDTWNPIVSNLNHTSGFKKFGQLEVTSYEPSIGINTEQNLGSTVAISDLISSVDLNCVKDFDVARERSILVDDAYVSNQITFRLPFLQRYQEFIGNRVLKIDDISENFNGNNRSFDLYSNRFPIFKIEFFGNDSSIISTADNTINLGNHYFVSGEEIEYIPPNNDYSNAIQISPTVFPGIGLTSRLPKDLYVVKVDNQKIKIATNPENALLFNPVVVGLTNVGIGSTHVFKSKNQNTRLLITINGTIQSPVVGTAITSTLDSYVGIGTTLLSMTGISSFFGGDLIQINNEIMKITAVSAASSSITVLRSWMGTEIGTHAPSTTITKLTGTYNVVDNTLNFIEPIWGSIPVGFGTTASSLDEVDYAGLTTSSRFSGRVFIRSALNQAFTTSYTKAYDTNYIFDDISSQFNGITTQFSLKQNGIGLTNIAQGNAIILINDIFQGPQRLGNVLTNIKGDYKLTEVGGDTVLGFTGNVSNFEETNDINVSNVPRGGIIVSVGSTNGLGYQPLVSAGGTAIVSVAGTIQSIAIGNSGSGYRVGIQTIVNVGVQTYSNGTPNITIVGYATVFNGNVISPVIITNPGSGFTSSNPPQVIFDAPLNYTNIPLVYSSSSPSGVGTGASIDIVVGQGSSVINFELRNFGYGYGQGDILTIPFGGLAGIPTDSSYTFKEFQIYVDRTYQSKFSGWSAGDFIVLDNIDKFFNGRRRIFPLSRDGERISFFARRNSGIDLESNLLVFMNDTLQTPGEGYTFTGGSVLRFTEPPRGGVAGISTLGDRCKILIYTGTQTIDVNQVDVLPSIKVGDEVQLYSDVDETFNQNERLVVEINAADSVITNNYAGQGVSSDELLERPISWCKQLVDKFIDEVEVGKDRVYYEPSIIPTTNIIQNVGIASTVMYVYSIRPFFDDPYEGISNTEKNTIEIVSQENLVSAAASCTVSIAGTVSNITLTNPGYGYTIAPTVTIQRPGLAGTTFVVAEAVATILDGKVNSIGITSGGSGYTLGPIESIRISEQGSGFPRIDSLTNVFANARLKSKTGIGVNASASITINPVNFTVSSIQITNGGFNYQVGDTLIVDTFDNVGLASTLRKWALTKPMEFTVDSIKPPNVLISPPARDIENIFGVSYLGDYGIIVGVGTTNVGVTTGITFDLYIPLDSVLRERYSIYNSGISTGDYFSVTYSNVGNTSISLKTDNSILGIGSTTLDNVYEVTSTQQINKFIPSVGITTTIVRVTTKISNYNGFVGSAVTGYYGTYNWGKISIPIRTKPREFITQTLNFSGISTNPIVRRVYPLKYFGYFV